MPATDQLVRKPGQSKIKKSNSPTLNKGFSSKEEKFANLNSPRRRGVYTRVGTMTPEKPSSALRKHARMRLSDNIGINAYISGIGHNSQEHSVVPARGGHVGDLPGARYYIVRGAPDTSGIGGRRQGRPLYGTKKPKN